MTALWLLSFICLVGKTSRTTILEKNSPKKWAVCLPLGRYPNNKPIFESLLYYYRLDSLLHFEPKLIRAQWSWSSEIINFGYLRRSTITSFFSSLMIDLPLCFHKSKLLFSKTFKITTLRFLNFAMRHGRRTSALRFCTQAWNLMSRDWLQNDGTEELLALWLRLYSVVHNFSTSVAKKKNVATLQNLQFVKFNHFLFKRTYFFHKTFTLKNQLFKYLSTFNPLFTFFIKKTDKMRLKHARGKVEKLKVIWKYVPIYKRLYQSMRWMLKDLKFQKAKDVSHRLFLLIQTVLFTPDISFLTRLKTFVHGFVFYKYRKTLLRTLKTTG